MDYTTFNSDDFLPPETEDEDSSGGEIDEDLQKRIQANLEETERQNKAFREAWQKKIRLWSDHHHVCLVRTYGEDHEKSQPSLPPTASSICLLIDLTIKTVPEGQRALRSKYMCKGVSAVISFWNTKCPDWGLSRADHRLIKNCLAEHIDNGALRAKRSRTPKTSW